MKIKTVVIALGLSMLFLSVAQAEQQPAPPENSFSATVGLVSQYRLRGITQSNENPAVQGSIDWSHVSGLYAGVWGSNVDFTDAHVETDVYGGYRIKMNGLDLDFGLIGYFYPGASSSLNYNYWEGKVAVGHDFGFANLTASVNHTPNMLADSGPATYLSGNAIVPIQKTDFSLIGSLSHQWVHNNTAYGFPDYSDWSLGVGYKWQGFDMALKYIDTSLSKTACADGCNAAGVFSVSRTF
jgi:uncharacterized protein (TIGR02001 family)